MSAVSSMHEHVHSDAAERHQPDQRTKDVRAVLGEQKRTCDDEKTDQDESCP